MTEQEIIKLAKTNWLAWQGLKELQPEVAAWMVSRWKDCVFSGSGRWHSKEQSQFEDSCTYRLRPDYEPESWWFLPPMGNHEHMLHQYKEGQYIPESWLEVTAEYADYLRNKPDGEWELRIVKVGDTYWSDVLAVCVANTDFSDCDTIGDRGYRWCKPKQPESGWREYAITRDDRGYCIWTDSGDRWPLYILPSSPTPLGLFGGVQFEGQNEPYWYTNINMLNDDCGNITSGVFPNETDTPAVPVKCRFWEEK